MDFHKWNTHEDFTEHVRSLLVQFDPWRAIPLMFDEQEHINQSNNILNTNGGPVKIAVFWVGTSTS